MRKLFLVSERLCKTLVWRSRPASVLKRSKWSMQMMEPPLEQSSFRMKTADRPSQEPISSARGAALDTRGKSWRQLFSLKENQSCVSVKIYRGSFLASEVLAAISLVCAGLVEL